MVIQIDLCHFHLSMAEIHPTPNSVALATELGVGLDKQ